MMNFKLVQNGIMNVKVFLKVVEDYLLQHANNSLPLPSLEDFCLQNNYDYVELWQVCEYDDKVKNAICKVLLSAKIVLEKLLLMDLSVPFTNEQGRSLKLDKKGIIVKLQGVDKDLERLRKI